MTTHSHLHVAIIMDGNGRWATHRALPRHAGHRQGANAVRHVVEAAPNLGIHTLSLFAFSADNWKRPTHEVRTLMHLLEHYLRTETANCVQNDIRLELIGRRDRLSARLQHAITIAENATAHCKTLHLRLAVDYSSRDAILKAAALAPASRNDLEHHLHNSTPNVDLLIRTGGEKRLSDFLLWECAYAELYFTDQRWPDFNADSLRDAVNEFNLRQRRFGSLQSVTRAEAVAS